MYGDINFIHYFCSWNDSSIKDDYILKTISFISTHFISTDFLMRAKKVFLFLLAILIADISALSKNRIIKDPEVEYTPSWISIDEIEFDKDATILRCQLHNRPHWWVKIDGSSMLKDRNSGREFKFRKLEGVEFNKEIWMPDEGHVACTLYYDPVPSDVKEVNLVENNDDPFKLMYGIRLDDKREIKKRKDKAVNPRMMTADFYLAQPYEPDTAWRFTNKRYLNMPLDQNGKAHVVVHLDNVARELRDKFSSISVSLEEQILRKQMTLSPMLDDDNCIVMDIDLDYLVSTFLNPLGNVFVQPGDTIEIFTTLESTPYGEPRYMTYRSNSESAMINALLPIIKERAGLPENAYEISNKAVEKGKESAEQLAQEWGRMLENIITGEDVRQMLINTPLSTAGKDIVMMSLIADMGSNIEDIVLDHTYKQWIYEKNPDGSVKVRQDSTWVPLDYVKVYEPMIRHKSLIYDNPLVLCESRQWVFINRSIFGALFRNYQTVQTDSLNYEDKLIDKYGMRGMFMYDLRHSQESARKINDAIEGVQLGRVAANDVMDNLTSVIAGDLAMISSPQVANKVLGEYRSIVRSLEGNNSETIEQKWTDEQKALWQKLTAPYIGNMLVVDFWGMGCGPCRMGMMNMRDKVEALKDEPIRFLYVTDEQQSPLDAAEAWMYENQIRGEHIFLSRNEWNMLVEMFSFLGIPHVVLAGKEGQIVQNGFNTRGITTDELKELSTRF